MKNPNIQLFWDARYLKQFTFIFFIKSGHVFSFSLQRNKTPVNAYEDAALTHHRTLSQAAPPTTSINQQSAT